MLKKINLQIVIIMYILSIALIIFGFAFAYYHTNSLSNYPKADDSSNTEPNTTGSGFNTTGSGFTNSQKWYNINKIKK